MAWLASYPARLACRSSPATLPSPSNPLPAFKPPPTALQNALSEFFADCGPIAEVRIAYDRETGRARGFAHIQFEEVEGAAKAIQLSGTYMLDREVYIESTTERQQSEFMWMVGGVPACPDGMVVGLGGDCVASVRCTCVCALCCAAWFAAFRILLLLLAGQLRVSPHALPPEWGAVLPGEELLVHSPRERHRASAPVVGPSLSPAVCPEFLRTTVCTAGPRHGDQPPGRAAC